MSILSFSNLSYSYDKKKNIFSNISAEMELGKIYAILGPSGCGKTTLLSLLGGLDSPTKGKILFNGEDITEKGFANHRRNHVSFIFQAYNLIDYMTPLENVKLTSKLPPEPVLEKNGIDERGNETECATTFRRATTTSSDCKGIGFRSTRYFG